MNRITATDGKLSLTRNAASLESLGRYAIRDRPAYRPLQDPPWNSCGAAASHDGAGAVHQFGLLVDVDVARRRTWLSSNFTTTSTVCPKTRSSP